VTSIELMPLKKNRQCSSEMQLFLCPQSEFEKKQKILIIAEWDTKTITCLKENAAFGVSWHEFVTPVTARHAMTHFVI
jgi:hypothetical protein